MSALINLFISICLNLFVSVPVETTAAKSEVDHEPFELLEELRNHQPLLES